MASKYIEDFVDEVGDEIDYPKNMRLSISKFAYSASTSTSKVDSPAVDGTGSSSSSSRSPSLRTRSKSRVNYREESPVQSIESPQKSPKRRRSLTTTRSSSESPKKKRGYAPPETYAHLNGLQDHLKEELDVMFCGINPGYLSASIGHHFANPTNHFWRCLHQSGLTDRLLRPSEDFTLPESYCLGLTNLVDRPSAEEAELSTQEMVDSVPLFLQKVAKFRPRIVCFVGKGIWLIVEKGLKSKCQFSNHDGSSSSSSPRKMGKGQQKMVFEYGIQPYRYVHSSRDDQGSTSIRESFFFVSPSSSGRVVSHQLQDKVKLFIELREGVRQYKEGKIDITNMTTVKI